MKKGGSYLGGGVGEGGKREREKRSWENGRKFFVFFVCSKREQVLFIQNLVF